MNRDDTIKILSVLRGAYPAFYRDVEKEDAVSTIDLWSSMFEEEPYEIVGAAVKAFISGDSKGFSPAIGQIKDRIWQITHSEEMTEQEAWTLVFSALRNSCYNSAEEFSKLPERIQRLVGSPNQLREWAMMDTETVQSVVSSNFQRAFRARQKSDTEYERLPSDVKQLMQSISGDAFKAMPEAPKYALGEGDYEEFS